MIDTILSKLYWLLGFFLCLSVAWFFYRKEFFIESENGKVKWGLISLRTITLFIIFFLCLDPFISYEQKHELKPELLILVDDSESMKLGNVSADSLADKLHYFKEGLSQELSVSTRAFGIGLREFDSLSFLETKTDFQQAFNEVSNLYDGRNIVGTVLISDGIINSGSKRNLANLLKCPIYTVGVGDTMVKQDLILKHLYHNDKVLVGNEVPVKVEGVALGFRGEQITLVFSVGEIEISKETIQITKDEYQFEIDKMLPMDSIGLRKIRVEIKRKKSEFTFMNNELIGFVDVLKQKKVIQLLFNEPHPDIAAFKTSIDGSTSYDLRTSSFGDYSWDDSPSLIVMFGMPGLKKEFTMVEKALSVSSASRLYFLNSNVNHDWLTSADFKVEKRGRSNDVQFGANPSFSLFNISDESIEKISSFPPLLAPYGEYGFARDYQVLGTQRIGKVNTEFPLVCFREDEGKRSAIIVGEGIWRWRLHEVKEGVGGKSEVFDELFQKMIKYLTVNYAANSIQLDMKNVYELGERIQLKATVENSIKEKVPGLKVNVSIIGEEDTLKLEMNGLNDGYQLEMGKLVPGEYTVMLSSVLGEKQLSTSKKIVIKPFYNEQVVLEANHQLLRRLSNKSKGTFHGFNDWDALVDELDKKEYKIKSYFEFFTESLMQFKWLLYVLIVTLGIEWYVRKWYGTI